MHSEIGLAFMQPRLITADRTSCGFTSNKTGTFYHIISPLVQMLTDTQTAGRVTPVGIRRMYAMRPIMVTS